MAIAPALWDELVAVQDLLAPLPEGNWVAADKGYLSYEEQLWVYFNGGVHLVAAKLGNILGNREVYTREIRRYRPALQHLTAN